MDEKVVVALVSVTVGWVISQLTSAVKAYWVGRKLKAGLESELEDIRDQLQLIEMICARAIQMNEHSYIEPTSPPTLQNTYFKQYYKEAFAKLNRAQRLSYQLIHSTLENVNALATDLSAQTKKVHDQFHKSEDKTEFLHLAKMWSLNLDATYKTLWDLEWYIDYHLKNKKNPKIGIDSLKHKEYIEHTKHISKMLEEIKSKARNLDPADFFR